MVPGYFHCRYQTQAAIALAMKFDILGDDQNTPPLAQGLALSLDEFSQSLETSGW